MNPYVNLELSNSFIPNPYIPSPLMASAISPILGNPHQLVSPDRFKFDEEQYESKLLDSNLSPPLPHSGTLETVDTVNGNNNINMTNSLASSSAFNSTAMSKVAPIFNTSTLATTTPTVSTSNININNSEIIDNTTNPTARRRRSIMQELSVQNSGTNGVEERVDNRLLFARNLIHIDPTPVASPGLTPTLPHLSSPDLASASNSISSPVEIKTKLQKAHAKSSFNFGSASKENPSERSEKSARTSSIFGQFVPEIRDRKADKMEDNPKLQENIKQELLNFDTPMNSGKPRSNNDILSEDKQNLRSAVEIRKLPSRGQENKNIVSHVTSVSKLDLDFDMGSDDKDTATKRDSFLLNPWNSSGDGPFSPKPFHLIDMELFVFPKSSLITKLFTDCRDDHTHILECRFTARVLDPQLKISLKQRSTADDRWVTIAEEGIGFKSLRKVLKYVEYQDVLPPHLTVKSIKNYTNFIRYFVLPFIWVKKVI